MKLQEHVSLASYTSFMVQASARYFASISSLEDITELTKHEVWKSHEHYFLGGGSNTLLISDYDGLIIVNQIHGLEIVHEDIDSVTVRVGAGEEWNHFVLWAVDQNLWGIENLVLIPGTVGASPVQNIGAYGVEVKDTIVSIEAYDTVDTTAVTFDNESCKFSYRGSIFKENPGRYFITHVQFRLLKKSTPRLSYPKIQEILDEQGVSEYTPSSIANAVVAIRDSKLPRVGELGTAGSFFENPIVSAKQASELLEKFPDMVQFPTSVPDKVKLSAAWLIEYCGFKGKRTGNVGTYEKHALVLVNHGGAYGEEVWSFAESIIDKVNETFGVLLQPEVQILGKK
jgi:UDP-N-acetylmuramate dehydrogenase